MRPNDILDNTEKLDNLIVRSVSPDDQMHTGSDEQYFGCGRDAINKIAGVLCLLGAEEPANILDFGCGHGRVGRYLQAAFPDARLVGCDTMQRAVDFYSSTFGVETVLSSPDLNEVKLGQRFSLIWSGSLMTHLPEASAFDLIKLFDRHLDVGGLAIFTTHGRYVAERARSGGYSYNLTERQRLSLHATFLENVYAYDDYEHMKGYGISMTPISWVMEKIRHFPELRVAVVIERGWKDHQDILALCKRPIY